MRGHQGFCPDTEMKFMQYFVKLTSLSSWVMLSAGVSSAAGSLSTSMSATRRGPSPSDDDDSSLSARRDDSSIQSDLQRTADCELSLAAAVQQASGTCACVRRKNHKLSTFSATSFLICGFLLSTLPVATLLQSAEILFKAN